MSLRKLRRKLATPIVAITLLGSSWNGNFPGKACFAEEWGRFRGANGTGIAGELHLDEGISDEVLRWKRAVPAGTSSPVLVDGKLLITSHSSNDRVVHCFDSKTGEPQWECKWDKSRTEVATPPNGPATSTPACDGQLVATFFPDTGLVVCTMDGEKQWSKDLGPFSSMHGLSASPILHDGLVIMSIDQLVDPYIVAFDAQTGKQKWRADRLIGITGGYSTSSIMKLGKRTLIISASPGEMVAYDAKYGEKVVSVTGLTNAPVSVPVVVADRVYYTEPRGEPIPMEALGNADKNKDGVIELEEVKNSIGTARLIQRIDTGFGNGDGKVDQTEWEKGFGSFLNKGGFSCVRFQEKGESITAEVVWKYEKTTPYIASSLIIDDVAYVINDGGILMAFNTENGDMLQRERVREGTGGYYASPIAGDGKIVLANLEGKVTLVQSGKPFKVLRTHSLEEPIVATPSISDGQLYIRSESQLFCFGTKG
jgi:outer membrane protein assembly factor BamB